MKTEQELKEFFSLLTFDEPSHTYHVGTERVKKSVSSKLKEFYEEFNAELIAPWSAKKAGCSTEEILTQWKQKGDEACTKGTRVHYYAEHYSVDRSLEPQCPQENAVKLFFDRMPSNLKVIANELRLYNKSGELFAGTMDCLLFNEDTGKYWIVDYKTNSQLDRNYKSKKLLTPFRVLLDTSYNKYQLQLSYYKWLVEQVPEVQIEKMLIVWLKEDTYEMRYCTDYSKELKELDNKW